MRKARTLYIKNPAAHRLAEHLGKRMGVTLTDAVIHALEEQTRRAGQAIDRDKIDALCARMQAHRRWWRY
jgi:hypothetical protein